MLLSAEVDLISKKRAYKRNSVWPGGSNGGKVVLTLLVKVIAFHIETIAVDV